MQSEKIISWSHVYNIKHQESPEGYCHGLAHMAIFAYLLGPEEYQRYRTRLEYMNRDAFLKQMQDFIQQGKLLEEGNSKLSDLCTDKWPCLVKYAGVSLNKLEADVTIDDLYSIYLETRAFLESMIILQTPPKEEGELFYNNPISQSQLSKIIPLTQSHLAEEKGGINQNSFTDIFSYKEIKKHLKGISSIKTEKPFAIGLSCKSHIVALFYNQKTKKWILDNHGEQDTFREYRSWVHFLITGLVNLFIGKKTDRPLSWLHFSLRLSLSEDDKLFQSNDYFLSSSFYSLNTDKTGEAAVPSEFLLFQQNRVNQLKKKLTNPEILDQKIIDHLSFLIKESCIEEIKLLIEHPKCNADVVSKALQLAIAGNNVAMVTVLMDHPKYNSDTVSKALQLAIAGNNVAMVTVLMDHPKCNSDVVFKGFELAAIGKNLEMVTALMNHSKCNSDVVFKGFELAAVGKNLEMVTALMNHSKCNSDTVSKALQSAVIGNNVAMVTVLMDHPKCNSDIVYEAFQSAIVHNSVAVVSVLIDHSKCNSDAVSKALQSAVIGNNVAMVTVLMDHPKCNSDVIPEVLQLAIYTKNLAMVTALVNHAKCDLNREKENDLTVLDMAMHLKCPDIINLLCRKGFKRKAEASRASLSSLLFLQSYPMATSGEHGENNVQSRMAVY